MVRMQQSARGRRPYRLFESGFAGTKSHEAIAERNATNRRRLEGPAPDTGPGWVRIIHGANEDVLPLAGQTVGTVRQELGGLFNVAPGAEALVKGEPVVEGFVLRHGEILEFLQTWGRKGVGRVWKGEGEIRDFFGLSNEQYGHWLSLGLPVHRFPDGGVIMTETDFDAWSRWVLLPEVTPDGNDRQAVGSSPDLLSEAQAVRYLRLDTIEIKNPEETLRRYRKEGHLRGTQVSKRVFYLRSELDALLKRLTDINPR